MLHERVGGSPPPDNREEIGKSLRHAFPLGLGSFEGLTSPFADKDLGDPALGTNAHFLDEVSREQ